MTKYCKNLGINPSGSCKCRSDQNIDANDEGCSYKGSRCQGDKPCNNQRLEDGEQNKIKFYCQKVGVTQDRRCICHRSAITATEKPNNQETGHDLGCVFRDGSCYGQEECDLDISKDSSDSIDLTDSSVFTTGTQSVKPHAAGPLFGPILTKIDYPFYLFYYINLPKSRKILLLGEDHSERACDTGCDPNLGCLNVDDYVWALAGNKRGECIDFFIEGAYHLIDEKHFLGGGLGKSRAFWESDERCGINFRNCQKQNIRVHYFDTRQLYLPPNKFVPGLAYPSEISHKGLPTQHILYLLYKKVYSTKIKARPEGKSYDKFVQLLDIFFPGNEKSEWKSNYFVICKEIFEIVIGSKPDIFTDSKKGFCRFTETNIFDQLIDYLELATQAKERAIFILKTIGEKIQKEISKLDSDIDKNNFIELFWEEWKNMNTIRYDYGTFTKGFDQWISEYKQITKPVLFPLTDGYLQTICNNILIDLTMMITDLYLLARVFMYYDMSDHKLDRGCPTQSYNKNIIIYGGAKHIYLYNQIVSKLVEKSALYQYTSGIDVAKGNASFSPKCIQLDRATRFF